MSGHLPERSAIVTGVDVRNMRALGCLERATYLTIVTREL